MPNVGVKPPRLPHSLTHQQTPLIHTHWGLEKFAYVNFVYIYSLAKTICPSLDLCCWCCFWFCHCLFFLFCSGSFAIHTTPQSHSQTHITAGTHPSVLFTNHMTLYGSTPVPCTAAPRLTWVAHLSRVISASGWKWAATNRKDTPISKYQSIDLYL